MPPAVDTAIGYAYELGIVRGYEDATFRPDNGEQRKHMASFIVRTLAHAQTTPTPGGP